LAQHLAQWSINMNSDNEALWDVVRVAMLIMMTVIIFGSYYDAMFRDAETQMVECSYDIVNMAKKINVTLLGKCEVLK
jgi:hypothetical protein